MSNCSGNRKRHSTRFESHTLNVSIRQSVGGDVTTIEWIKRWARHVFLGGPSPCAHELREEFDVSARSTYVAVHGEKADPLETTVSKLTQQQSKRVNHQ